MSGFLGAIPLVRCALAQCFFLLIPFLHAVVFLVDLVAEDAYLVTGGHSYASEGHFLIKEVVFSEDPRERVDPEVAFVE